MRSIRGGLPHWRTVDGEVRAVIELLRPAIRADGGDIELLSVDASNGAVTIGLTGECAGCSSSTVRLGAGVARIIRDHVPAVARVLIAPPRLPPAETQVTL